MGIDLLTQPSTPVIRQFLRGLLLILGSLWASIAVAQTSLQLPFFDDFATAAARAGSTQPDPARWVTGSGVYINNTMAINQPTINVATFDGLQANGRPYVSNNPLEQGYTDVLESRPINLIGLSAGSGVYLSFYWQTKGLGELPDPGDTLSAPQGSPPILQAGDSLTLQFKDVTGIWKTVWGKAGGQADSTFNQAFVQVSDARYFYDGFAFRFRAFGRRSGPFDTWHIDYVYLNKGRSATDQYMIDIATQRALSPLLKRYTAMPMSQYKIKGAAELADSVSTVVKNLINNPNPVSSRFRVQDDVTGRSLQNDVTGDIYVNGSQQRSVKPNAYVFDNTATKALLRYEIDLQTSDNQNSIFQRDPSTLLRNDTISAVAALDNYYAYDDGSWEYAQQIRQREQIAVRFILNKPDTIGSVRACIVPFTTDQTGQPFVITVYANQNGKPGIALYQQSFPMQYPDTRNGFVDYKFTRSVIVKDTFYIGYQQISSSDTTFLRLGFDKNSPFGENIFYNGGTNWEQNLQKGTGGNSAPLLQIQGAFMLRPVMGGKLAVVTATTEPNPVVPLRTYPNPTSGRIQWDDPRLTRLEVISSTGRLVHIIEPERGQQTLDLSYLPDGLYIIRLFANQQTTVQKLIIQH
ncbi:T9SS type A sorting domain-containing protein [Spirosoma sp. KCTC 42546]|uniref:T9SS type A sorting domain-containing protein n=1 Tax=Spirosoma sp. KCTC 42546 TaxID=2520506 RepID=UPI00115A8B6D|nr:T9SS type A sorting domain-containing protein [Spirosoma sp. KCTC 42546]QDK78211.1 T9SS type A sorting domain-containing protein [Spirosoma sp. KCTC 42546]